MLVSMPKFQSSLRLGGQEVLRPGARPGAKETRTPNIQLAKLALYQLSYNPEGWA